MIFVRTFQPPKLSLKSPFRVCHQTFWVGLSILSLIKSESDNIQSLLLLLWPQKEGERGTNVSEHLIKFVQSEVMSTKRRQLS